ncbi:related to EBP2 - required for pre-rRNA processing and ribosomal subunit assembly [Ustilago sp. UG-2017a]|nr:related to EBP2 - required for pre-rRNA processing and ribosomal subunit assembly [Ustilago sp. UG-2017a]
MPATPKSTPKKATASANGTPAASPSAAGTPSRMTRAQARATGIKIKTPSPLKKGGSTPKASSKKAAATASAEEEEESPSKSKAKSITTTPTKSSSSPSKSSPKKSPSPSKAASASSSKLPASHAKLTRKPTSALATAEPIVAEYSEQEEEVEEDEDDEDEESDLEEGHDVSEKGMQRLMAALGEDGLDEVDMAALDELAGDEEGEEDEDDEDEDDEDVEKEDAEGEVSEDEDKDEEEQPEDGDIPAVVPSANGDTLAASIARSGLVPAEESEDKEDEEAEEAEEEGDVEDDAENAIAYEDLPDDVELSEQAKASRVQRIKVNNESALKRIYEDIRLDAPSSKLPWIETMRVTYPISISAEVTDVENDLERELAFYKQALHAAVEGRKLVEASGTAFSRPSDYFAEMVKTDEHMELIRQKLLDESAAIKASEAAKKQRELKKFGKKVQVEKLQERIRNKKEMNERVNGLKRKLGGGVGDDDGEEFDVRLEEAIGERASKKQANGKGGRESTNKAKMPRSARDAKYGFGGKKKYSKSNTAESTNDFSVGPTRGARGSKPLKGKPTSGKAGFRPKQKSGAAKRPGKARRAGH